MEEGVARFQNLKNLVHELETGRPTRNTEWYDKQFDTMVSYRNHFGEDLGLIEPTITNVEFRNKCKLAEYIMQNLETEYNIHRWFALYDYCRLNKTLIWLVEYVYDHFDDELEITKMFGGISLSRETN